VVARLSDNVPMIPCFSGTTIGLLAAALSLLTVSARADVSEAVQYRYYAVPIESGRTLKDRLIKASPIRQNGQILLGHTQWQVRWDLQWDRNTAGRCKLGRIQTHLKATITLPQQSAKDPRKRPQFEALQQALRKHQEAHLNLAREAAKRIDQRLWQLPAMSTCSELNQATNNLGQHLMIEARQRSLAYDQREGQGRREAAALLD
jgi:predicted secreted Zn-dependent protease